MRVVHEADVRPWEKVGEPRVLAKKFGAYVEVQDFRNPHTGKVEEYSLFGGKDWRTVCTITAEDKIILVQQYKQGADETVTEFPAGTPDEGEDWRRTAARELREETGFEASEIVELGTFPISTRKSPNRFLACVARGCHRVGEPKPDPSEHIRVLEVTQEEFWRMVDAGEIVEISTIVAATLAIRKGYLNPSFGFIKR